MITGDPNQPNGVITEYRILQRRDSSDSPTVIFAGLAFQLSVSDLRPFTTYSFQVEAENAAGNVTSIATRVTTLQAPPSSFAPPSVVVLSATTIALSWSVPGELNGELVGYQVYRDGEAVLPELTTMLSLLDQNLLPFTEYVYSIEVCSGGGCANSSSVSNTTSEALPEMVFDLIISNVSPRSVVLSWQEPGSPNGEITEYVVMELGASVEVFRGLNFTVTVTDLVPFSDYSFQLMVCNSIGCVTSNERRTQTSQTDPEGLDVPRLRNLTSTSVAIEWTAPAMPNGNIATYVLRRGNNSFPNISRVLFQGLNFSFNDMDLIADTLYFYTIEAVNGGGRVVSSPSFFRTVPDLAEGIRPPILDVLSPSEISVMWSEPDRVNGEISAYRLYMENEVVLIGLQFSYQAINLDPFTSYSFFVEVCNQAGCASSITVFAQTQQALAADLTPPLLTVLSPTTVQVSWIAPTRPNGIISQYQIRRRFLDTPASETIQYQGPANVFSFPNSGLTPFTSYEYRLGVTNGAGSVFSEWLSVQTSEAIPAGLSLPFVEVGSIFARNITATWFAPTSPNGIILHYILEYRLAIDPVTLGVGEIMTTEQIPANVTTATATGLSPVTGYEFRVVAVNSAGRGLGEFEVVTTSEDVPEGIGSITVMQRTATSLVLTWSPPITNNGIIREYMVLLDGVVVYQDTGPGYTVTRLQPFTSYSLQLGACTSAGCAFGSTQSATTAEVAPFGQARPSLGIIPGLVGSVSVSWSSPVQPNGRITQYQIQRQVNADASSLSIIHTTSDVMNLTYVDTETQPAQSYLYAITAINSAGRTDSEFSNISTPEAAPEGLTAPVLTPTSASMILVSWLPPTQPNGVITSYGAFRTGGSGPQDTLVFSDAANRGFTDDNLMPFTQYTYTIQACTAVACSLSPPGVSTTREAPPTGFPPPTLRALSEASISVEWVEPANPNGVITSYTITLLPSMIDVVLNEPTELSRNITDLQPFTNYTIQVEVCNSEGCATSVSSVRTLESVPDFIAQPQVSVVNATALMVMWVDPPIPNGIITLYQLRRNGMLIFSGNDTMVFVDSLLMPNQFYSYTVQAYTAMGPGRESAVSAVVQTPLDTPEGVFAPNVTGSSSTSILARWVEPRTPNGVIQRYVLLLGGEQVLETIAMPFQFEAVGLSPFTSYSFQLLVCTTTCGSSEVVSATTLEAPPEDQSPPTLSEIASVTVQVSWSAPLTPNGIITGYDLERRQLFEDSSPSEFVVIFSGSGTARDFVDRERLLRPTLSYEYRISSNNGAGRSTSAPAQITLSEAAPESVPLPLIGTVTSTSINVIATPPDMPNGVLIAYRLYRDGIRVLDLVPPASEFAVIGLQFFTQYLFSVEACTTAGCTRSDNITQRTGEATPTGLSPPRGVALSNRMIEIRWTPPQQPNGIILRSVGVS